MPTERYYIPDELNTGQSVLLEGTEFHHLANVMRSKEGESIEIVNGNGCLAVAKIDKLEKKKALLKILQVERQPVQTNAVILAQAIPRINRLDFILEKGTELGMTHLWLFPGERSERHNFTENQMERFSNLCIAAMKQCGRLFLPEICLKPPLNKWTQPDSPLYFGDVNPEAPLLLDIFNKEKEIIFCTGPESGFTEQEVITLKKLGGTGVKLHTNILRTDTASIAALALLTHLHIK